MSKLDSVKLEASSCDLVDSNLFLSDLLVRNKFSIAHRCPFTIPTPTPAHAYMNKYIHVHTLKRMFRDAALIMIFSTLFYLFIKMLVVFYY